MTDPLVSEARVQAIQAVQAIRNWVLRIEGSFDDVVAAVDKVEAALTAHHEALDTLRHERDERKKELNEILCNVSQIFNGWKSDPAWTDWDEQVAASVVKIHQLLHGAV